MKSVSSAIHPTPTRYRLRSISLLICLILLSGSAAFAFDAGTALSVPDTISKSLTIADSVYVNPELAVENASSTVFDDVAPSPGTLTCPAHVNGPVTLSYSGTADSGGSGLKLVTLWYKKDGDPTWASTGQTRAATAGSFGFTLSTEGKYLFSLQAEDNAGNISSAPADPGLAATVYDKTAPTLALVGDASVTVSQGESYVDAGATANDGVDGDITSSIVTSNPVTTTNPGAYTVTYNVSDAAGNAATEARRQVTITAAYTLTLTQPARGELSASPAPSANGRYAPGTVVTVQYAPQAQSGYAVSSWVGATQAASNANEAQVTMSADTTVSVALARETGSITVAVTPETATWVVTDGDSVAHVGTGSKTLDAIPTGSVSIAYNALTGYTAPASESNTLAKGATVAFRGTYQSGTEGLLVSVPTTLTGAPSSVVSCPINLNDASNLTSFSVTLKFDKTKLECLGATNGSLVSSWNGVQVDVGLDTVVVSGAGTALAKAGGALATVRLSIKSAAPGGATPLTLANVSLNRGALTAKTQDGSLTISGVTGTFTWGDVDGDSQAAAQDAAYILQKRVGLITQLPIAQTSGKADDIGGGNVSARTPAVVGTYDASLILQRVANKIATFPADVNKDGKGPDTGAQPPTGPDTTAAKRVVSITGALTLKANTDLQVPIQIDNADAVVGYYAEIKYDPTLLEFVGFNKGQLTQDWAVPSANAEQGVLRIASAGAQALTGTGPLALLTFRATASAPAGQTTALQFTTAELNDGLIAAEGRATAAVPTLAQLSPKRGGVAGGQLVTLTGANLDDVTSVTFGGTAATWFRVQPGGSAVLALTPKGVGVVDVQAITPSGTATLRAAYTYFQPDVFLSLRPQASVKAGGALEIPVYVETPSGAKPTKIQFILHFDPSQFAVPQAKVANAAVLGDAAAGKLVGATLLRAGELQVSISGGTKTVQPGVLCTLRLTALGGKTTSESVVNLSDVKSETATQKSLEGAAGMALSAPAQ